MMPGLVAGGTKSYGVGVAEAMSGGDSPKEETVGGGKVYRSPQAGMVTSIIPGFVWSLMHTVSTMFPGPAYLLGTTPWTRLQ